MDWSVCDPWTTIEEVVVCGCTIGEEDGEVTEEQITIGIDFASEVLFNLTGQRWPGICDATVRPCARRGSSRFPAWPNDIMHATSDWQWMRSWGSCSCNKGRECGCNSLHEITLGYYPVQSVDEVLIDGVALDPSAYRLDESRWLVRIDGDPWPCCQDLAADVSEPDTWQVSLSHGHNPPQGGVRAASLYACEIAKGCAGVECNIPSRVSSISRQGTTYSFASAMELTRNGLTGVPLVDSWVGSVNGGKRYHKPATITSPDIGRRVRRVEESGS